MELTADMFQRESIQGEWETRLLLTRPDVAGKETGKAISCQISGLAMTAALFEVNVGHQGDSFHVSAFALLLTVAVCI